MYCMYNQLMMITVLALFHGGLYCFINITVWKRNLYNIEKS